MLSNVIITGEVESYKELDTMSSQKFCLGRRVYPVLMSLNTSLSGNIGLRLYVISRYSFDHFLETNVVLHLLHILVSSDIRAVVQRHFRNELFH